MQRLKLWQLGGGYKIEGTSIRVSTKQGKISSFVRFGGSFVACHALSNAKQTEMDGWCQLYSLYTADLLGHQVCHLVFPPQSYV